MIDTIKTILMFLAGYVIILVVLELIIYVIATIINVMESIADYYEKRD